MRVSISSQCILGYAWVSTACAPTTHGRTMRGNMVTDEVQEWLMRWQIVGLLLWQFNQWAFKSLLKAAEVTADESTKDSANISTADFSS